METALLIGTATVGLGALVASGLLLRMIIAGDYLPPRPDGEGVGLSPDSIVAETKPASPAPALPVSRSQPAERRPAEAPVLGLAWVVHFVHELPDWESRAERKKAAEDLAAIRRHHDPDPRADRS